jgi:DNA-binding FadR family transcriptional regulator
LQVLSDFFYLTNQMTKTEFPLSMRPGRARAQVRHSLHGHVVGELGERIVRGELKPGEILPAEEVLAARMAVSRTILREAIKVLSAKGLIESRPKIGTRVREERHWSQLDADVLAWRCASMPTDDFANKLMQMREIIEPAAAALAAGFATAEQILAIENAYREMDQAASVDEWSRADLQFHEAVLQATNNALLSSLFAVIETALATYFVLSARTAENFRYALPQHQKVLNAIAKRQPSAARRAMQGMIADSNANVLGRRHKDSCAH